MFSELLSVEQVLACPEVFDPLAHPRAVSFNVPHGFDVLLSMLEADASLRAALFADLDLLF